MASPADNNNLLPNVNWSAVKPGDIEEVRKERADNEKDWQYSATYKGRKVIIVAEKPQDEASLRRIAIRAMKEEFGNATRQAQPLPTTVTKILDSAAKSLPSVKIGDNTVKVNLSTINSLVEDLKKKLPLPLRDLPAPQKNAIADACVQNYQQAMQEFETIMGSLLVNHPKAQEFTTEISLRFLAIVKAFRALEEAEHPSKTKLLSELKDKFILGELFGRTLEGAGGSGFNFLSIEKVLSDTSNSANVRQKLSLMYTAMFSFLSNKILAKPEMITKINAQLKQQGAHFQIDAAFVESEKKSKNTLFPQASPITQFRNAEQGRSEKPKRVHKPGSSPVGPKLSEIPGLTLREARAALGDPGIPELVFKVMNGTAVSADDKILKAAKKLGEQRVRWESGQDTWKIEKGTTFSHVRTELGLPEQAEVAGPSGTTDAILHMAKYLGLNKPENMQAGILAAVGWMGPIKHHSMHEMLLIGNAHGVPYTGKEIEKYFSKLDPTLLDEVSRQMHANGKLLPKEFLTAEFQKEIARQKGFIAPERSASASVHAGNPWNTDVKLQQMNKLMRELEDTVAKLGDQRKKKELFVKNPNAFNGVDPVPGKTPQDIDQQLKKAMSEYNQSKIDKIKYVKATYPDNPVYAMANPRTLSPDTMFFRSGDENRMFSLITKGWNWDAEGPATHFTETPGKTTSQWAGGNLMGEKGLAMSMDEPTYRRFGEAAAPFALGCRVVKPIDGVSIMTVDELTSMGKFTKEEVERGYQKLQNSFNFVQTDALPPGDTEVVFQRLQDLQGNLHPEIIVSGSFKTSHASSIEEFTDTMYGKSIPLNPNWSAPAAPQPQPATPATPQRAPSPATLVSPSPATPVSPSQQSGRNTPPSPPESPPTQPPITVAS